MTRSLNRRKLAAAVRSIRPAMFETLEDRRLLSGTISVVGTDAVPGTNRLIFNVIKNLDATTPNATHSSSVVTVSNLNTSTPLTINSITTSGPFSTDFGTAARTVTPGGSTTFTVTFTQSSLPAHGSVNETNYTTDPNGGAAITGALVINSSDTGTPTSTTPLAGYWQYKSENNNEPNLTTIVNALAGYTTNISTPYSVDLTPNSDGSRKLYGQEVYSATGWVAADPTQPVAIQSLAEFHTEGNTVHSYWYGVSDNVSHVLFTSQTNEGQTLLPHNLNGQLANTTFTPNGPFGFRVDNEYSDDAINNANGNAGGGGHHFRFYPLYDTAGNAVANTWVVAMDYAVLQTENFDFQDNVFIVSNMRANTSPPAPTGVTATSGATPVLSWNAVSYSPLAGYNVFRSTSLTGTYTQLNGTIIPGTSFADSTAPAGLTLYYQVTAVDGSTGVQSTAGTAIANTPGGPVANADTVSAFTAIPTPINVLNNDTDTTGTINPATVTITAGSTNGATLAVNTTTGAVTFTSIAGYAGTDTFSYTVADNNGAVSSPATVTVNVSNPGTTSPSAVDDTAYTLLGKPVTIGVLGNDVGVLGLNGSSVTIVTAPTHGSATNNADGSITYTPSGPFVGGDTFTYTVADNNGRTSGIATVSVYTGVEISSAAGASHTLNYVDGNGTAVVGTLNRGVADVYFGGTGSASVVVKGAKVIVAGAGLVAQNIALSGTTGASTLSLTSKGGSINVRGINASTPLNAINGKTVTLAGNANLAGLNSLALNKVTANGSGVSTIILGGGARTTAVALGTVSDTSISSGVPIRSLSVLSWSNTQNGTMSLRAPSVGSIVSKGAFAPSLVLTGSGTTLGGATILGSLGTGFWNVNGNAKSVTVGSTGTAWGGQFNGSVGAFTVRAGGLPADVSFGSVGNVTVTGNLTGAITAGSIKNLKVNGSISATTLRFGSTAGSVVATGAMSHVDFYAGGNVGTIQAGSFADSTFDVGTASAATTVGSATAGALGSAVLGSIKTTGRVGTVFSDTSIVASTIKSVSLGTIGTSNGGTPFGVAARRVTGATVVVNGATVHLGTAQLLDEATASAALTAANAGDFKISLL